MIRKAGDGYRAAFDEQIRWPLKVNVSTLQNYETGKTVPDWEMVKRIEQVYSFPADFIIFAKCSA